ncbi:MAG: valine--tRNA ligase [Deltaproteobacteria bacterium]|nr:valine--tRNA ligase [Deltaproteobacteria bacterium]
MNPLEKVYDPAGTEEKWYARWTEKGYFRGGLDNGRPYYSIVIPPPNVTGSLHMGHALNNTLQDILVRWKRMDGVNTLWMPGTDHAGIATQNVVERDLASEGRNRHELGRDKFIERVWKWRKEYGGVIINQLKRLGSSCDWSRERFTMDEGLSRAVREVFVRLYEEGLIYRDNYITNWCPRCHTALSDVEVEHEDTDGHLYHIRYPLKGREGFLTVATTRPETMLGDTAVAVHPEDGRYLALHGEKAVLPILEREIPVIADTYVDREFGTGVVKITPAHDPNDFEVGLRHDLPQISVMDRDARMNGAAGKYAGMDRYECRRALLDDLEKAGLVEKIEPHGHAVGHCYRCKTVVEPILSLQWFVRMKELAAPAIAAVEEGRIRFIPKGWENTYFEWMRNIRDWCISRQIWWGHRIPAWICDDCGGITVDRTDPDLCAHCRSPNIKQETDVLDTWFSSALWPFSTLGWPDDTPELRNYYPTSVLITGFDIIFFWVARMIMMGLRFMGEVPFRDVYIHALVRDAQGQKMSKSKGNVIDPLIMIDKFGTDAFRFTLTAFAAQGRDVRLSEERIQGYRNFTNKIWNASRFALMNLAGYDPECERGAPEPADRWIQSRLNRAVAGVREALDAYKFNEAASILYRFFWHEFCDWYIELVKDRLYGDDPDARRTAQCCLVETLHESLRLLHPFMPFITEEIYQHLPVHGESIMVDAYPVSDPSRDDSGAEEEMELVMEAVTLIRNVRGEMNIAPGKPLDPLIRVRDEETVGILLRHERSILSLGRCATVRVGTGVTRPPSSATAVGDRMEVFVPLEGVIDLEAERARLMKNLAKVEKDLAAVNRKLANESFTGKAPAAVVEKERARREELMTKERKINAGLSALE